MRKNKLPTFIVTTGDPDGIGPEVSYKALAQTHPSLRASFVVVRSQNIAPSLLRLADRHFKRYQYSSLLEALAAPLRPHQLKEVITESSPAQWVYEAGTLASRQKVAGIVTAPLSKTLISAAGYPARGHTEILQHVSRSKHVTMSFWGPKFSIALASIHVPLRHVPEVLTPKSLENHLKNVALYFPHSRTRQLRIGVLGLNPHAGESGIIGTEESKLFEPIIKKIRAQFPNVLFSDPLVPDAAFLKNHIQKYDVFFCAYHDQGLIPFKMAHGQSHGCQITLGLPFIRTSVDHGTAKDIFGKNKAHPGSMKDALSLAVQLYLQNTFPRQKVK